MDRHHARLLPVLALVALATLGGCEGCSELFRPTQPPGAPNLGLLPRSLNLRWPAAPQVDGDVLIRGEQDLGGEPVTFPRVRLVLEGDFDLLEVAADDVVIAADGFHVREAVVLAGARRVRFDGGRYGTIRVEQGAADVTIDRVRVEDAHGIAILGGHRVAIVQSHVTSTAGVALFAGAMSEDVSVVDCMLDGGADAALHVDGVTRAAIVDNWLGSAGDFAAVLAGDSDWVVASRNTTAGGGVRIGADRGHAGTVWWWVNTMHVTGVVADLVPGSVDTLMLAHNTVHADGAREMWSGSIERGWTVEPNAMRAYRTPPSAPVRP